MFEWFWTIFSLGVSVKWPWHTSKNKAFPVYNDLTYPVRTVDLKFDCRLLAYIREHIPDKTEGSVTIALDAKIYPFQLRFPTSDCIIFPVLSDTMWPGKKSAAL